MNAILPPRLTVDEFLRWSVAQERGRFELENGLIVAMPSETIGHIGTKGRVYTALLAALARAGIPYYALPDGPTVRIAEDRAYEPDALLAPMPMPPTHALEVPDPIAVFEVLSPTPKGVKRDLTTKLEGYARVPSIEHYVVVDPDERVVIHFRRQGEQLGIREQLSGGNLRLDPPGLTLSVPDMLA